MIDFSKDIIEMYKDMKPAHMKIYCIVRDSIYLGNISSNEKITEEGIAKALGSSRTPVRTALAKLRNEGLLQNITKHNLGIQEYSESEILDLMFLAEVLEGKAAYLAAQRGVTDEDLSALCEVNDSIASYKDLQCVKDRMKDYGVRDLHMQFHLLIAKFSGNRFLYKDIVELRNTMRTLKSENAYSDEHKHDYSEFLAPLHWKIIDAIKRQCPEDAEFYMRYELKASKEVYRSSIVDSEYPS